MYEGRHQPDDRHISSKRDYDGSYALSRNNYNMGEAMTDMRDAFENWFDMLVIPADVLTGEMDQDARVEAIRKFTKQAWADSRKQEIVLPDSEDYSTAHILDGKLNWKEYPKKVIEAITDQGYVVAE